MKPQTKCKCPSCRSTLFYHDFERIEIQCRRCKQKSEIDLKTLRAILVPHTTEKTVYSTT